MKKLEMKTSEKKCREHQTTSQTEISWLVVAVNYLHEINRHGGEFYDTP